MARKTHRRDFLKHSALAGVGFWVAGGVSLAKKDADRLRFACIGIAGKGGSDSSHVAEFGDVLAICDIDDSFLDDKAKDKRFKDAKKYNDFRKMFDEMAKEIDAVTVSTPDHTHTLPSMIAIRRMPGIGRQSQRLPFRSTTRTTTPAVNAVSSGRLACRCDRIEFRIMETARSTHWWFQYGNSHFDRAST